MQKAMGMNSYLSLQEDNVREYLKTLQQRDIQYKKEHFANKGRDTLLNGYIKDEFKGVCCELQARGAALSLKYYFYILVNILLGHYMLTRGSNRYSTKILNL